MNVLLDHPIKSKSADGPTQVFSQILLLYTGDMLNAQSQLSPSKGQVWAMGTELVCYRTSSLACTGVSGLPNATEHNHHSQVASGTILVYAQCRDTYSEGKNQPYCLEVLQHVSHKGVFARCVVCQSQIMANLFQVPLQRNFHLGSI